MPLSFGYLRCSILLLGSIVLSSIGEYGASSSQRSAHGESLSSPPLKSAGGRGGFSCHLPDVLWVDKMRLSVVPDMLLILVSLHGLAHIIGIFTGSTGVG